MSGHAAAPGETPAEEVVRVVTWLDEDRALYQVNGGWGVDALVGRQTRPHRDVDVFVDAAHVEGLVTWLEGRGYEVAADWRPVRVELAGPTGRVDVHPMTMLANGDGLQEGLDGASYLHPAAERVVGDIGGRPVVVASAARLRALRAGYEPRPVDVHDLALLRDL